MKLKTVKLLSVCAVLLTLWLNFAAIEHNLDLVAEHHLHHDCQLFANAQHATCNGSFIWHDNSVPERHSHTQETLSAFATYFNYQPRSPPLSV
ncbi:DUF2607 domain-containing protein [Vibrio sp. AK197]